MNKFLLFAILSALVSFVVAQPPLPTLPSGFLLNIEANFIDQNKTLNQREYYDFVVGKARIEVNTADAYTHYFVDFNKKQVHVVVNGQTCDVLPSSAITGRAFQIRSTSDLLVFGDKYNETYIGVSEVRGVPCDTWQTQFGFVDNGTTLANGTTVNAGTIYNFTLTYFWSVESWGFRSNVTRKPMRAILNGTKYPVGASPATILHYYELVNFVPRNPPPEVFDLPTPCVGIPNQLVNIVKTAAGASLATGMFFLGLFIGIIASCVSIWVYCRRRQMQRDRMAKGAMAMSDTTTS
jgi:hypothetical protein